VRASPLHAVLLLSFFIGNAPLSVALLLSGCCVLLWCMKKSMSAASKACQQLVMRVSLLHFAFVYSLCVAFFFEGVSAASKACQQLVMRLSLLHCFCLFAVCCFFF
jgi:vacuolar-type H+-ATPase subunit I/STV1